MHRNKALVTIGAFVLIYGSVCAFCGINSTIPIIIVGSLTAIGGYIIGKKTKDD